MEKNLVAVYGSLKKGFGNYPLLSTSNFLGECTISGFRMFSFGAFPFVLKDMRSNYPIHCEVYEVSNETLQHLDYLEGYPQFYNKDNVSTPYGRATIYVLNRSLDSITSPEIKTGNWTHDFNRYNSYDQNQD